MRKEISGTPHGLRGQGLHTQYPGGHVTLGDPVALTRDSVLHPNHFWPGIMDAKQDGHKRSESWGCVSALPCLLEEFTHTAATACCLCTYGCLHEPTTPLPRDCTLPTCTSHMCSSRPAPHALRHMCGAQLQVQLSPGFFVQIIQFFHPSFRMFDLRNVRTHYLPRRPSLYLHARVDGGAGVKCQVLIRGESKSRRRSEGVGVVSLTAMNCMDMGGGALLSVSFSSLVSTVHSCTGKYTLLRPHV